MRTLLEATTLVAPGSRIGIGGVLLRRKPLVLLRALVDAGVDSLNLHVFLASLDAELLAAAGCLAQAHTGYVGFEQLGRAPAWTAAVESGAFPAFEHSELQFVSGLAAAASGLPFLPTRGAAGSSLVSELGLLSVTCPYSGEVLSAVPAMPLDVAVLHAEAASASGAVLGPEDPDFLADADANLARAAAAVIVTTERIVGDEEIRAGRSRILLFPHEVTAVVEAPGGAGATAVPSCYPADIAALRRYLEQPSRETLSELTRARPRP